MNRQEKEALVSQLRDSLGASTGSFIVTYRGLSVGDMQSLRNGLREKQGQLKVAKVRLLKRALEGNDCAEGLIPHMQDQLAIVFAENEPPAVAKFLNDYAKGHGQLQLLAGCIGSEVYGAAEIVRIASLPSREVLLAKVAGSLNAPASNLVRVLQQLYMRLLWTLKQASEKKQ